MSEKKSHSEGTKQVSEPDSDMTQISELSDHEFKTIIINMPTILTEKVATCGKTWVM